MYKYDGLLVHQSWDDHGIIEIVEREGVRFLHFGTHSRQSSMLVADPNSLHSLYARAMMAGLLFLENPQHILMIGLGGGSLAKFLLHQFTTCRLRIVEFRSSVLKVARSHFALPFDARMKIMIGCGADHVKQQSRVHSERFDLILIDAYHENGMDTKVASEFFFANCQTLLMRDGLLVINLWATDKPLFRSVASRLNRIFENRLLFLPVRGRGNIIGFAFGDKLRTGSLAELIENAKKLETRYHLEFPTFLYDFRRNNTGIFQRVIKA